MAAGESREGLNMEARSFLWVPLERAKQPDLAVLLLSC